MTWRVLSKLNYISEVH